MVYTRTTLVLYTNRRRLHHNDLRNGEYTFTKLVTFISYIIQLCYQSDREGTYKQVYEVYKNRELSVQELCKFN